MKKLIFFLIMFVVVQSYGQMTLNSAFQIGGGINWDGIRNVTGDNQGNVYVCGWFSDITDFDPTPAIYTLVPWPASPQQLAGTFICKYAPNGSTRWARTFAADTFPWGSQPYNKLTLKSIESYTDGSVYVFGMYNGQIDFDPGPATYTLQHTSVTGAGVVLKFDSMGIFQWVKEFKPTPYKAGIDPFRMFLTGAGEIIVGGLFYSKMDFDPDPINQDLHTPDTTSGSIFVIKLSSNGSYIWGKQIDAYGQDIHFDPQSGIHVTGSFHTVNDFDPGPAVNTYTPLGNWGMFVLRLGHTGQFHWVKILDSYSSEFGYSITTDANHNVVYAGLFKDTLDFDPGTGVFLLNRTLGNTSFFISKLDTGGNFLWAKKIEPQQSGRSMHIRTDQSSNIYFASTNSIPLDIDPGPGVYNLTLSNVNPDGIFISGLDPAGNFLCGATFVGTSGAALESFEKTGPNSFYMGGSFGGTLDFDPSPNQSFFMTANSDLFFAKLTGCGAGPTGLDDFDYGRLIKAFPQPSDGLVTISGFEEADNTITIFNMNGQKVQEKQITGQEMKIELPSAGIYFFQVNGEKEVLRGKLISN